MPKYTPEREQQIRDLLAQLEISGKSVAAFAQDHGVAAWTVYGWRKRFPRPSATQTRHRHGEARADLVEVCHETRASPSFEVWIGEVQVRVPAGFDADELARVLEAVRSC